MFSPNVRTVEGAICVSTQQLKGGGVESVHPQKIFEFRDHEIVPGHFVVKMMLLGGQMTDPPNA